MCHQGGVYGVIPVKRLRDSKSRLSSILNPNERATLTLLMLEDVVTNIQSSELVHRVLIVTPDEHVTRFAKELGVESLLSNSDDLNLDLENAVAWCSRSGAESTLIVLADLPTLSNEDIRNIIEPTFFNSAAVIAPSKDGGTNALFLHPCGLIKPSFGVGSFERHMLQLGSVNAFVRVYRSMSISLDIDTHEDVQELLQKKNSFRHPPKSLIYLEKLTSKRLSGPAKEG